MLAGWSIQPAAVWMPCDLQLTNWTMEPALCAPGHPIEYASNELFDSCHQISVPICEGGQQCEYEVATKYDPIETTKQEFVVDLHNMEFINPPNPIRVFKEVADECNKDVEVEVTKCKMHRYPTSIRALCLNKRYTTPTVVAIGPYYHGREDLNLKQAEKMKHVAAYQCIKDSGHSVQTMYDAVVPVAHGVRSLYDRDMEAGIGYDDFLHMMFFDACFLVQYMLLMSDDNASVEMEESLLSFFDTNDSEIFHDIMLLENQIPWPVVETVMEFRHVSLETFIYNLKGCLQDSKYREQKPFRMDHSYQPSHLLGLLRYYIVGRNNTKTEPLTMTDKISLSVSANELAEIGIKLKANENAELIRMGVETKCTFGELLLAPLSLDDARASCLVSMAALELCTTSNFQGAEDEASTVCSYLLLLAMLVAREEDVQKLRTQHLLRGAGLANKEVLDFFTKLHGLRLGSCYVRTMTQIEQYKSKRRTRTKLYAFLYRNKKKFPILISLVGIFLTLVGIFVSSIVKSRGNP